MILIRHPFSGYDILQLRSRMGVVKNNADEGRSQYNLMKLPLLMCHKSYTSQKEMIINTPLITFNKETHPLYIIELLKPIR